MAKKAKKRSGPGRKGYSAEKKAEILAAARKEGLTGVQVRKRFGISTLTFYRWRGPARGPKARAGKNGARVVIDERALRTEVRTRIARVLPGIIQQEIANAFGGMLGKRRPGRPRKV
jgi:transposase-like protein